MATILGPTDVYQAFNEDWEILYVGISHNAFNRLRQHRRKSLWWPQAAWFRVTRYDERADAEKVEALTITLDDPPYNIDRCARAGDAGWADIQRGIHDYPSFEEHEFHVSRLEVFRHG